ncbi:MAG TPA: DUF3300 domain-containing protein [Burkholderiales bacterium]|nr:DUF3300 domain-containing protein [Burkholderiales bacterium]
MRSLIRTLLCLLLCLGALNAHAQRAFSQAELDAMLAPIALYPDPLLTHVLTAAIYPQDVAAAGAWSRANPNLIGDQALRAVEPEMWHPSVKALVAYPDILGRMAESPQWVADLGEAYSGSYPLINGTIQQLRARAEANGNLRTTDQQYVYRQNDAIYVQPVYPNVVYAPYYNPYVVYGTWWWPAYRPVYWRPWVARPVYVTRIVHPVRVVQPVRVMPQPVHVVRQPIGHVRPSGPMPTPRAVEVRPYRAVPESRRAPIIQSAPVVHSGPVMQSFRNSVGGHQSNGNGGGGHRGNNGGHGGGRHRG